MCMNVRSILDHFLKPIIWLQMYEWDTHTWFNLNGPVTLGRVGLRVGTCWNKSNSHQFVGIFAHFSQLFCVHYKLITSLLRALRFCIDSVAFDCVLERFRSEPLRAEFEVDMSMVACRIRTPRASVQRVAVTVF